MNLVIDAFRDMILLYEAGTKKVPDFWFEKSYDYSLVTLPNQQRAIAELAKEEGVQERLGKGVHVLMPDFGIGFGTFDLPALSHRKLKDVFSTRFKSSYPNYDSYFVAESEYERRENGALYFYCFCKKELSQGVSSALKGIGSNLASLNFYASGYTQTNDPKSLFPRATLFLGKTHAELIFTKGKEVLFIYDFGFGANWFSENDSFVETAYNPKQKEAVLFTSFATENFAKKVAFSDENIANTAPNSAFSLPLPKAVNIMKNDVLTTYLIKNRYRKFYGLVADIVSYLASGPWFLPITNIDVVSKEDVTALLNSGEKEMDDLSFTYLGEEPFVRLAKSAIVQNRLFDSELKKERRRFDWKKLLTMEIGRKKA